MSDIEELTKKILTIRNERDWGQFHNFKDMALSLSLEASEVIEHFQWKNEKEIKEYIETHKEEIGEELADVLYWVLLISHDLGIDLREIAEQKIKKISEKYPVEKSKGKNLKYTEL